jgi:hypothetical protein
MFCTFSFPCLLLFATIHRCLHDAGMTPYQGLPEGAACLNFRMRNTNGTPIRTNHPSAVKQSRNARKDAWRSQKVNRLRLSVNNRIGMREAMSGEIIGEVGEKLPVSFIERSRVGHKRRLMVLGSRRRKDWDTRYFPDAPEVQTPEDPVA